MKKIELTISPKYVPTWTYVDAVRELFQNALDQETQNPDNKAEWEYNEATNKLIIANATSVLTAASLLLGQTTKLDDSTIGQFGEGYKIATLVLLREGKQITFYNYAANEIWRPRFVKSRRFGTDILTFFIDKQVIWDRVDSNDLVIVVEGITPEEYANIKASNLHLRDDYKIIEDTKYGTVINLPGQVFVNGLFVCEYKPYKYGYNFKPGCLRLDRDRKMANSFDLQWLASKVWQQSTNKELVMAMIQEYTADVYYINDVLSGLDVTWKNFAYEKFVKLYGTDAIPVTSDDGILNIPEGYKGVVVSELFKSLVVGSNYYKPPKVTVEESTLDRLHNWYNSVFYKLSLVDHIEFEEIMKELEEERND